MYIIITTGGMFYVVPGGGGGGGGGGGTPVAGVVPEPSNPKVHCFHWLIVQVSRPVIQRPT